MRFDHKSANPEALQAMLAFNRCTHQTALDPLLIELIKIRASQINGCAFCLDMHATDTLKLGESPRRLYVLAAWRESGMFTDKERAALALTDAVTEIANGGVPDDVYQDARAHFSEREFVDLLMVINVINCWNRIGVTMGLEPPRP